MNDQKSTQRTSKRRTVLKALAGAGIGGSGLVGLSGASSASNDVLVVDKNGDQGFDTIQAAVNKATEGDTIKVLEGEYKEQVSLYDWHEGDDLTIIGDPGESDTVGPGANAPKLIGDIDETKKAAGFRLGEKSGITIKGFEILDFKQEKWGTGIKGGKSNIELTDNEIHTLTSMGIAVWRGNDVEDPGFTIKRNEVYDVGKDGIHLGNLSNSIVKRNKVEGAKSPTTESPHDTEGTMAGIRVVSSVGSKDEPGEEESRTTENVNIVNNTVVGHFHRPGIWIFSINRNDGDSKPTTHSTLRNITARKNEIWTKGARGASMAVTANAEYGDDTSVSSVVLEDNRARNTGERPAVRIGAVNGAKVQNITLANNDFSNGHLGCLFFNSWDDMQDGTIKKADIIKNDVHSNSIGIYLQEGVQASEFEIRQNNIMDNEMKGIVNAGKGTLSAEKNYWGSPTGPKRENPAGKVIGKGDEISGDITVTPWEPQKI